jgi:hypothetical protein
VYKLLNPKLLFVPEAISLKHPVGAVYNLVNTFVDALYAEEGLLHKPRKAANAGLTQLVPPTVAYAPLK